MQAATATRDYVLHLPHAGRFELLAGEPRLLGVVNLTPDSFSDGGLYLSADAAVDHALRLIEEGADLLDLGAESTRPGGGVYGGGARSVPAAEELERLLPVLERLRPQVDVPISIDTRKAEVARASLALGADLINDVSALGDPEMAGVVAAAGCPIILMHSRGDLATMQNGISFRNVVQEVADELEMLRDRAVEAGIRRDRVLFDPGLGFGKTAAQNLELVRGCGALSALDAPLVIGASRKSFIGELTGAPPEDRLDGSLAAAAWAAFGGTALLRVHDVGATGRFLTVWKAVRDAGGRRAP